MNRYSKYYVFEDNQWKHKTPLKLVINPILRRLQFWTSSPYVIASKSEWKYPNNEVHLRQPYFVEYTFERVPRAPKP